MHADVQKVREMFLHAVGKLPPEQWDGYWKAGAPGAIGRRDEILARVAAETKRQRASSARISSAPSWSTSTACPLISAACAVAR